MMGEWSGQMIGGVSLEAHIGMMLIGSTVLGLMLATHYAWSNRNTPGFEYKDCFKVFALGFFVGAFTYGATMIPGIVKAFPNSEKLFYARGQSVLAGAMVGTGMVWGLNKIHGDAVQRTLRLSQPPKTTEQKQPTLLIAPLPVSSHNT